MTPLPLVSWLTVQPDGFGVLVPHWLVPHWHGWGILASHSHCRFGTGTAGSWGASCTSQEAKFGAWMTLSYYDMSISCYEHIHSENVTPTMRWPVANVDRASTTQFYHRNLLQITLGDLRCLAEGIQLDKEERSGLVLGIWEWHGLRAAIHRCGSRNLVDSRFLGSQNVMKGRPILACQICSEPFLLRDTGHRLEGHMSYHKRCQLSHRRGLHLAEV